MADQPPTVAPASLLTFLDNSRKQAEAQCPRRRYLQYHAGPTGYGLVPKGESLPLATGSAVHSGLAAMGTILQRTDRLPDTEAMREIVSRERAVYRAAVEARGFLGILKGPDTDQVVAEQCCLISGLLWALRLQFFPWLHEHYRVLSVEEERIHLLSCTCGAGPLPVEQHDARGCAGVALQLRQDLLAAKRSGGGIAYFEAKTTGWDSAAWSEQWETRPQLGLGTLDAAERFGAEVTEIFVLGLGKGARRRDKDEEGNAGLKRQQTSLCYGYCRPGNPPLSTDDWLPSYQWTTPDGEVKRASRAHRKRGVWELAGSDWPVWQAYRGQDPEMPAEEFWVRQLPPSVLEKVCFLVGPLNRQDAQIAQIRESWRAGEERWQEILWDLYEYQQAHPGTGWADAGFQRLLAQRVEQTWNCRPFGTEHQCPYVGICHQHQGWDDPLGSGRYQPRRPHHQPELDAAIARGLLPAEAAEVEEEG